MEILECLEYGAGSCRNEDMIIGLRARVEAAEAQLEAVRQALGGYPDSDLVSLATTINAALSSSERELEQARDYVDNAIGNTNPAVPLVDRIVRLVSMLAANSTTAAELDAENMVDALARRVYALEGFTVTVNRAAAKQIEIEERDREQVRALQGIVRKLDDATAEQVARLIERVEAIAQRVRAEAGTNSTAFRNIDAAWRKMDARIAALEQTVANLQRLAQIDHGPEAGL